MATPAPDSYRCPARMRTLMDEAAQSIWSRERDCARNHAPIAGSFWNGIAPGFAQKLSATLAKVPPSVAGMHTPDM
jgi:hypothetical protein